MTVITNTNINFFCNLPYFTLKLIFVSLIKSYYICSFVYLHDHIIVHYNFAGNATGNKYIDYYGPFQATVKKGETSYILNILIIDDKRFENNEVFHITAIPPSLPIGHHHCTTDIFIFDDDGKLAIYSISKVYHLKIPQPLKSGFLHAFVCIPVTAGAYKLYECSYIINFVLLVLSYVCICS